MTYRYTAQFRNHWYSMFYECWKVTVLEEQSFDDEGAAFVWATGKVARHSWYCDSVVITEERVNDAWVPVSTVEIAPDGSREVVA